MQHVTWREAGRIAFFVACAAYMLAPVAEQGFGVPLPDWVRGWRMYASVGTRVCQVSWYKRTPDGDVALAPPTDELPNRGAVWRVGAELCDRRKIRDLRVDARCGSRSRWQVVEARSTNLCAP
jgi:hypothetical protein